MGRFSTAIFGRKKLPERCLIYGGFYVPQRKEWVRSFFDAWSRIKGNWVKYSFATRNGREYLLVFNVYGGAVTLELIHLLKDGEAKKVFFIGSMGGKDLPIGTLVVPTEVVDKAGLVMVYDPSKQIIKADRNSLKLLKTVLNRLGQDHVEGKIVSVPCALHKIRHVKDFIKQDVNVLGVELETSTFCFYSQKEGLENYVLLYVSDNRDYDIISQAKTVKEARKKALKTITHIALETLD